MARATRCGVCGQVTIRISWSGLRTHEECRQRSHLARTHKLATLDDKRGFFPGTVTDRVVRKWLEDDPLNNLGVMPDMVDGVIDAEKKTLEETDQGVIRWKDSSDRAKVRDECIEAVTLIEPDLLKWVVPFEYQPDYHFEAPLMVKHPSGVQLRVILNGYMDILVRAPRNRWLVWDVKHTRDNSYWRKTIGQLGFYDLAVELEHGVATTQTGLMQPLCTPRIKPYKPNEDTRVQLLTRISNMAKDIYDGEKSPREDTKLCGWCPTKHACVKFQPVRDAKGRKRVSI